MTKDEALKLALEALEYHTVQTRPLTRTQEAITAIKRALAAPVQPVGVATGCASHEGFFTVVFRSSQPIPDGTGLYTTPPAQPAPVPLTDDPLQGAVDWFLQADGEYFCTATVQRTLRIGYNRAKRLCDTAKERAAHGIAAAPQKGQP
jgi:DNA segregation ATPase FtsK/SpoIIIE-like protein